MKTYLILLVILIILGGFLFKILENFTPSENNKNYINIGDKYCLVTKQITDKGGVYSSEIKKGPLPKLFDNQKAIIIDNEFTEKMCKNKEFGSGRQRGGFVCMDFITKKMANKYNLEYSPKTCFDLLDYVPVYTNYSSLLNK